MNLGTRLLDYAARDSNQGSYGRSSTQPKIDFNHHASVWAHCYVLLLNTIIISMEAFLISCLFGWICTNVETGMALICQTGSPFFSLGFLTSMMNPSFLAIIIIHQDEESFPGVMSH